MLDVYLIGCGGIGGYIIDRLPMVISSLSLDLVQQAGLRIEGYLENAGNTAYPCVVGNLVFIDGDVFNPRNAMRQGMGAGSKLAQRMLSVRDAINQGLSCGKAVGETLNFLTKTKEEGKKLTPPDELKRITDVLTDDKHLTEDDMTRLQSEMVRVSCLQGMRMLGYNEYIRPSNFEEIMPRMRDSWNNDFSNVICRLSGNTRQRLENNVVVFVGVDNAKTRYELSKYLETFDNCLMINGGNSKTEGHVTIYERVNGEPLDPALYEIYPDISPTADKRPDELACTTIAPSHDQIAVTNSMVADVMLSRFVRWARNGLFENRQKDGKYIRYNEILIDTIKPSVMTLYHPLTKKEN